MDVQERHRRAKGVANYEIVGLVRVRMDSAGDTYMRLSESTSRSFSRGRSCGPRSSSGPGTDRSQSRGRSRHKRCLTAEDESLISSNGDRLQNGNHGRSLRQFFSSSSLGESSNPSQPRPKVSKFQSNRDLHVERTQNDGLCRFLAETSRGGLPRQDQYRHRRQGIARFFSRRRIYELWTLVRRNGRGR